MSQLPPSAPQDSPGLVFSKSTGSLQSRLRPTNENLVGTSSTQNLHSSASLNTMKPKSMLGVSSSMPVLAGMEGPPIPHPSKATKLRQEISTGALLSKTISNSPSAAILAGHGNKSQQSLHLETGPVHIDASANQRESPNRSPGRPRSPGRTANSTTVDVVDTENHIHVQRNSFLASLNMSQRQLHDLYKVPHTFFYLRIREGGQETGAEHNDLTQDGRGNAGSVYDLELVALDKVDKTNYFTLSKEGVTQFRNKVSTFTGLAQWEREYKLFHKIANINFFKIYKRWKVRHSLSIHVLFINLINCFVVVPCRLSLYGERVFATAKWILLLPM